MSKYSIDSTTLSSIGDAIRSKDGTSVPIQVSDFATKISNIPISIEGNNNGNDFLYPYNTNIHSSALLGTTYYYKFSILIIPYSIWSQYNSITFNYIIKSDGAANAGLAGCFANFKLYFGYLDVDKIWNARYAPSYSKSLLITDILTDFYGELSDIYTINCNDITITDTNNKDIFLITEAKRHAETDTESLFQFRIGNFTGVKK